MTTEMILRIRTFPHGTSRAQEVEAACRSICTRLKQAGFTVKEDENGLRIRQAYNDAGAPINWLEVDLIDKAP